MGQALQREGGACNGGPQGKKKKIYILYFDFRHVFLSEYKKCIFLLWKFFFKLCLPPLSFTPSHQLTSASILLHAILLTISSLYSLFYGC